MIFNNTPVFLSWFPLLKSLISSCWWSWSTCQGILWGTASSPPTIASLGLRSLCRGYYNLTQMCSCKIINNIQNTNVQHHYQDILFVIIICAAVWSLLIYFIYDCLGRERAGATRARARPKTSIVFTLKICFLLCCVLTGLLVLSMENDCIFEWF